jgi:hypothetical protein
LVSLQSHEIREIACLAISFAGAAIRMLAAGYTPDHLPGRGDSHAAATPLITDGIFSLLRHPRYLGDYFIGLGVVLIPLVWWLTALYTFAFWLYYRRIVASEEADLRRQFGTRFDQWAAATPAFLPRFGRWRPASRPFSFRTALRCEHTGLLLVIALHSGVEWLEHLVLEQRVMLELFWIVLALVGLTTYFVVRHLEKHTRVLNAPAT